MSIHVIVEFMEENIDVRRQMVICHLIRLMCLYHLKEYHFMLKTPHNVAHLGVS